MFLRRICLFWFLPVATTLNMAFGQAGATGTILGTITDSTGAVLPNVKVTVTNTATNVAFQTESNSAGDFNAPSLQPWKLYGFRSRRLAFKNPRPIRSRSRSTKSTVRI